MSIKNIYHFINENNGLNENPRFKFVKENLKNGMNKVEKVSHYVKK